MPVTKRKGKDVVKEPLDAAKGEITELKSTLNLKIAEVQAQKVCPPTSPFTHRRFLNPR
jgi:hypothetical protein